MLPAFSAVFAAVTEVTPDMNTSNTKPGLVAGLIFLFLLVSAALLMRSMSKHLKIARENLSQPKSVQDNEEGNAGSGT